MALEYTPETVASGFQSTESIERNFEAIEEALADGLSRSGASPNAMGTDLDMQAHRVYNLPNAVSNGEPVTYQQWTGQLQAVEFGGYLQELQTATDGQTTFTLGNAYTPGLGALRVFVNGLHYPPTEYTEVDVNTLMFSTGLEAGDEVAFVITSFTAADYDTASTVQYLLHDGTYTNVQAQLDKFYAVTAAETTAGVTVVDQHYPPGNVLRYGAVGDGVTDDSTAFNAASAVIGTYNVVVPPGSYMLESQWLVTAPSSNRSSVFAYGAEILTTGAIAGIAITGGSTTGGLTVFGLQINHRGNADATYGFELYGAWNARLQDCSVECDDTATGYAGYFLRNTTPASDSTGCFWCLLDHCQIRRRAGGDGANPDYGVKIQGACNATVIRDCNLTGITAIYHTVEAGYDYAANGLLVTGCAIEGYTTAYHWEGSSAGGCTPVGMRFIANRFESGTTVFSFTGADATSSATPPFMFGNYMVSNAGTYLNNPLPVNVNRFEPSETPTGTVAIFSDNPFIYRNSGTNTEDHAALFQSVTGKGIAIQAAVGGPEPGTDVASLTLRSGSGATLAGNGQGTLYQTGVASISRSTTEAKNLRGTVTLSGGTAAVSFSTAESDASYYIVTGCSAAEAISVTSKATGGFTVTSSNGASTAVVDWVLIR